MGPRQLLATFDGHLAERALGLEAVAIGGEARPALRFDVVPPGIPPLVAAAVRGFAAEMRAVGEALDDDWLGEASGPLPEGWETRVEPLFSGGALRLACLGRDDLLRVKLLGLCERGLDLGDCVALAPTAAELAAARTWVLGQEDDPGWPAHVGEMIDELGRRLGHGV